MSQQQRQPTALITGGSSGIGYAAALEFASRGYKVFTCARRLQPMESLKEKYPNNIITFQMDVTSLESIEKGYEFVKSELIKLSTPNEKPKLDVLYNNAGASCTFPALDVPDDAMIQCFELNVYGPIRLTKAFSDLVINAKGSIAFTGSLSGIAPFPFGCVYAAAKAAIHQYCSVLQLELEWASVNVVCVITGGVNTLIADTRPLPKDSIYLSTDEGKEAFEYRQKMAVKNKPMEPEKYVKSVINEIESHRLWRVNYYEGSYSTIMPFAVNWVPRWLLLFFLRRKFHLIGMWDSLRAKLRAENDKKTV